MDRSTEQRTFRNASPVAAYGVAAAAVAAATIVRWLLEPVLGNNVPYATFYLAVVVAGWYGGLRPALLVTLLSLLLAWALFVPPRFSFALDSTTDLVGLVVFLIVSLSIAGFSGTLRAAERRSAGAEYFVREQAERLRTTLASIGDAVITTDTEGRVTNLNGVAESLTGWTNESALGQPLSHVFNIVNEETRQRVENPAIKALRDGVIVGLANHTVLIAKDGTERPIDDSAAPVLCKEGEIVGCVLVFRDISERKLLEAEQRNAEAQVATTIESITDGFMRLDQDWRVVYENAEAERLNQLPHSQTLGKTIWELFPAVVGTKFEAEYRRCVAEQVPIEFENFYEPWSRWYSLKCYPMADGGLSVYVRDITEHKQADDILRLHRTRLDFVLKATGVGLWLNDLPLSQLNWDDRMRALFFVPPGVEPTIELFYDRLHPDDREPTRIAVEVALRDGTHYDIDHRVVDPATGAVRWIRSSGEPIYDDKGKAIRFDGVSIDLTDRKLAEGEIAQLAAESERQRRLYETVLTNTPDFVYVFSLDHKVLYANDALIKMWGRGHDGAIGKTFLEIGYEPWHAEMHDREIDQVAQTRQPIRGEVPFNGTNGRRMYDYIFVPVIGADGEVEAVAGTTRDVTERHAAEAALRESEERQAFLIRLADTLRPLSDPIDVQAEASRVLGEQVGANRVVYFEIRGDEYVIERDHTTGVRPLAGRYPVASFGPAELDALLEGRTVIEADATTEPGRPPDERAAFAAIQVRGHVDVPLVKGGRFVAGMTLQVSDRRDWTRQEVSLIEETAERTWAAVERVRAEKALRQSEERRRLALDAAELGAWQIDLLTNTFTTDERFRIIFAGTVEAMDYEQAFAAIHPDDQERIREAVAAATRADDPAPYAEEYRVIHPDGSVRWVFAKGRANYDREVAGRLVSFDGTIADITDRKLIEEERERLVGQLRDAGRRKDEFLATLAHELRNPLAPIRNGLQIIRMAGANGTIEQAGSMMERQLGQMVRLVDDLLDVSRVTSGKLELRKARVELRTVIDAAVETSSPIIDEAGHKFTVAMPDDPIWVDGDVTRLAQVVSNLLNNSAKYMHRGGHVRLTVGLEDDTAIVSVADDGIGIPPAMLDKVFEMFAQVDRALEKTTGGLGIGLSLVKGLVEMHGGTIEAHSEGEGRGSEFVLRLPVALSIGQKVAPQEADEQVGSSSRRRILVADDNVDSAKSMGKLLELLGNDVSIANDGWQAVNVAETFRPDVILLDIGMPKLNGYEAARRIRAHEWGRDTILLALTGWGQEDDRKKSSDAGFDHHLVKPVEVAVLMKVLAGLQAKMK